MSDRFDADLMDDLMNDAAEGPAGQPVAAGDDFDDWDAGEDLGEDFDADLGAPVASADEASDMDFEDFEGGDGFEAAGYDDFDGDSLEDAMADALAEDDADAFARRIRALARRARRVVQTVGRGVGAAGRLIGPIASAIPLPQAQAIGRIANVAGRLLADGADEFEAIDELVDNYDDEAIDAAAPVIAGLSLRRAMPQIARMPQQARRQLVRNVAQATRTLVRSQGAPGARAAARLVQSAQRAVRQRRLSPRALPQALRRVAQRAAQNPRSAQGITRPLTPGRQQRSPGRGGGVAVGAGSAAYVTAGNRRMVLRGPMTITIRVR